MIALKISSCLTGQMKISNRWFRVKSGAHSSHSRPDRGPTNHLGNMLIPRAPCTLDAPASLAPRPGSVVKSRVVLCLSRSQGMISPTGLICHRRCHFSEPKHPQVGRHEAIRSRRHRWPKARRREARPQNKADELHICSTTSAVRSVARAERAGCHRA